ncbi:MAG: alpha/beta hydrolase [Chitinophagaceae bacterium]|nr:alpha/beta hydrolase [Chitinophagaceae bacterium]
MIRISFKSMLKSCNILSLLFASVRVGIAFICITNGIYCQDSVRYRSMIFEKVRVTKDILYNEAIEKSIKPERNRLDVYMPGNDTAMRRPLIVWMHGGGFKLGSKKSRGIPLWSQTFARRGYVCAAVNYRFSKKNTLNDFTELVRACYYAVEDLHKAVDYLKTNHGVFGIDTNHIILAGNSAGGMIALQTVYASYSELGKLAGLTVSAKDSAVHNGLNACAVINFWGAMYDTTWLHNAKVPIVSVHGRKDRIVPYDHKKAPVYGSYAIHNKADALGIPNSLLSFDEYAHELQKNFNPFWAGKAAKKRWLQAGAFAAEFLYRELFFHRLSD